MRRSLAGVLLLRTAVRHRGTAHRGTVRQMCELGNQYGSVYFGVKSNHFIVVFVVIISAVCQCNG